ncbi:MAG: methyltransferase [Micrococcales bacterium]|nr:methyltransferase [Micrococcales bacterium]
MSDTMTMQRWVAFGPAGAVGSVLRRDDGYVVQMMSDGRYRGVYPSLNVAKQALHAAMGVGAERPEFREH